MDLSLRSAALGSVCALGLLLQGCAGMKAPYETKSLERDKEPEVTVITPQLLLSLKNQVQVVPVEQDGLPSSDRSVYRYHIAPNDVLRISVPSVVIFNTPGEAGRIVSGDTADNFIVYDDGTVYLPFGGSVSVAGATPAEAQARIVSSLSRYLRTGQVVVSVAQFRSQRVLVTGQVQNPGYQQVTDVPLTLVGAISAAGGILQLRGKLDPRAITTATSAQAPQGVPEYPDLRHVLLKRGDAQYVVDVEEMLRSGDVRQDFVLRDGDVVIVPPLRRANVFVLGEVIRPALVEVNVGEADLAKVLVAAGGVNQLTANARRIYVVRGDFDDPTIYQLDSRYPDALLLAQQFPLKANDIVYVAEAPIGRWNRALSQILPTLQGLLSTAVIVNTVDDLSN